MALRRSWPLRRRAVPTVMTIALLAPTAFAVHGGATAATMPPTSARPATAPRRSPPTSPSSPSHSCSPVTPRIRSVIRVPFTIDVVNHADRSMSVPVDITIGPDLGADLSSAAASAPVTFYSTQIFVGAGGEATEDVVVTPAQWYGTSGRFTLTASVDGEAAGEPLAGGRRRCRRRRAPLRGGRRRRRHRDLRACGRLRPVLQRRGLGRHRR